MSIDVTNYEILESISFKLRLRLSHELVIVDNFCRLYVASGALYVRNYGIPEANKNLIEMITYIKKQFVQNLKDVDWMDVATKQLALEKVSNMHLHKAYPDELLDDDKVNTYYKNVALQCLFVLFFFL